MSRDRTSKVQGTKPPEAVKPGPQQAFKDVLKKVPSGQPRPPPLPTLKKTGGAPGMKPSANAVLSVHAQAHTAQTQALGRARTEMNTEAGRLHEVRAEGQSSQEEGVRGRLLELVLRELKGEQVSPDRGGRGPGTLGSGQEQREEKTSPGRKPQSPEMEPGAGGAGMAGGLPPPPQPAEAQATAAAKAQATLALVERIEAFVKSNRPALAVTVGGALNARVEVERTGPGEVALRVQGTRGPPPAEDLSRIREAVRARGLKLSSISVA